MDKYRLKLSGMSEIVGLTDIALLSLVDENKERQLIVTCDKNMRKQIQMRMMNKPELVNRFPEVAVDILKNQAFMGFEVVITGMKEGEYLTEIRETIMGKNYPIRCSDGILFAMLYGCGLYATREVMMHQSVPFAPGSTRVALPINVITDEMLQMSLKKAIEVEDYEMASNLRDELKKRHEQKDSSNV